MLVVWGKEHYLQYNSWLNTDAISCPYQHSNVCCCTVSEIATFAQDIHTRSIMFPVYKNGTCMCVCVFMSFQALVIECLAHEYDLLPADTRYTRHTHPCLSMCPDTTVCTNYVVCYVYVISESNKRCHGLYLISDPHV